MARTSYAFLLMVTGRRDEGFGQIREAQKLDPLSEYIGGHAAQHHFIAAEYDQAIEQEATLGQDQNHLGLARAYAMQGLYTDALDQVEKARAQSRNDPVSPSGRRMDLRAQE